MSRVVLAKPGLDGHEAGVLLVGRALRDAGFEVVYLGPRQTPQAIVEAVVQEDADVLGLSILTGGHVVHSQRVLDALAEADVHDVPVIVGGIIPPDAAERLRAMGVAAVFGPGEPLRGIVARLGQLADRQRTSTAPMYRTRHGAPHGDPPPTDRRENG